MIDDKVKQAHAELTARDKRNSLFVVAVAVLILAASFFVLRDYGTAGVGKVVNLPADDRCTCTEEGCDGFLSLQVGEFLVGETTGRRLQNSCATPPAGLQQQPTILRLIGESCAEENNNVQFTFEGRTSTFQSVCITDEFLTAQNSNKLAEFMCEGNNSKVQFESCDAQSFCSENRACVPKLAEGAACTSGRMCQSGNCRGDICLMAGVVTCTDSDNGETFDRKGQTTGILNSPLGEGREGTKTDVCVSGNNNDLVPECTDPGCALLEYSCLLPNLVLERRAGFGSDVFGNDKLCRDGALVPAQQPAAQPVGTPCSVDADCGGDLFCNENSVCDSSTCTDTDDQNSPSIAGVATLDNAVAPDVIKKDECSSPSRTTEWFCLTPLGGLSHSVADCPQDTTCQLNDGGVAVCRAAGQQQERPPGKAEGVACDSSQECAAGLRCIASICQTVVCTDTEGAAGVRDVTVPGTVTLDRSVSQDRVQKDECVPNNPGVITEYFCEVDHRTGSETVPCPQDTTCQLNDGGVAVCRAAGQQPARGTFSAPCRAPNDPAGACDAGMACDAETRRCASDCVDSDGGKTAGVRGTTFGVNDAGTPFSHTDSCINEWGLNEYSCEGNTLVLDAIPCGNDAICADGACVPRTEPPVVFGQPLISQEIVNYLKGQYPPESLFADVRTQNCQGAGCGVVSYSCDGNGFLQKTLAPCATTCDAGVCQPVAPALGSSGSACQQDAECEQGLKCRYDQCQTQTCRESDQGANLPESADTTTLDNSVSDDIVQKDECVNENAVKEWSCDLRGGMMSINVNCPQGTTCQLNDGGVAVCLAAGGGQCRTAADADCNSCVNDGELISAITHWRVSADDAELITVIAAWRASNQDQQCIP